MKKFIGWTITILVLALITLAFPPLGLILIGFVWWTVAGYNEGNEQSKKKERDQREKERRDNARARYAMAHAKERADKKAAQDAELKENKLHYCECGFYYSAQEPNHADDCVFGLSN